MNTTTVRQRLYYMIGDAVASAIATLIFNLIRHHSIFGGTTVSFAMLSSDLHFILSYFAFPAVMLALSAILGFYNQPAYKSRYDLWINSIITSACGGLIIYLAIMVNDGFDDRILHYSILSTLFLAFALMLVAERLLVRHLLINRMREGIDTYNVIVVGRADSAREFAARLGEANRAMGFRCVGIVDFDASRVDAPSGIIHVSDIEAAVATRGVRAFVVLPASRDKDVTASVINRLYHFGLTILLPLDFYDVVTSRPKLDSIVGLPLVDITNPGLTPAVANLKRIGDILVSFTALLLLLPVFAIIALCVKFDSDGSVFYRQERVGLRGRIFNIIKFRSMIDDAEPQGPRLSSVSDPRVTRVGHVLRKYRLDELPQFVNVLLGDMSLVGPRPERRYFLDIIEQRVPSVCTLHNVRPGITSLGVVKCGYASEVEQLVERTYYDLLYVDNISFGLDIKILFHTVNTVITGRGV